MIFLLGSTGYKLAWISESHRLLQNIVKGLLFYYFHVTPTNCPQNTIKQIPNWGSFNA